LAIGQSQMLEKQKAAFRRPFGRSSACRGLICQAAEAIGYR